MLKSIFIKLKSSSLRSGPFRITDQYGDVISDNVSLNTLAEGIAVGVEDNIEFITIESLGNCKNKRTFAIKTITPSGIVNSTYTSYRTTCLWTHLKNPTIYNFYYNKIEPYIIEYPFSYQYNDQILQNVKDYTKAYKYFEDLDRVADEFDRIETNDKWFNKAILYNGQQCTGLLELVPKPVNNLKAYNSYPKLNANSKTITFTKSDNFYQYNTFWSVLKDTTKPMFVRTCESLSVDKVLNDNNMDYSTRSFKKAPLRAKDLKVRHILDDKKDIHLVSQFIVTPSQISYK